MVRKISGAALAVALAIAVLVGWNLSQAASGVVGMPMLLPPDPDPLSIETSGGPVSFTIEIADDEEERSRGLMFREDLPADRGMLFVFESTSPRGFWMKNTPLPLDLLFLSENGRIVAIRHGIPFSEDIIAPIYPVRFVLELHEGTAGKFGIRIGARVRHPAINAVSKR